MICFDVNRRQTIIKELKELPNLVGQRFDYVELNLQEVCDAITKHGGEKVTSYIMQHLRLTLKPSRRIKPMNKYEKTIDDVVRLVITDTNAATVTDLEADPDYSVTVQLADDEEAKLMISEFEDSSGDMMHNENSIFGRYTELHRFRP
jgi:hypothetical protein